MTDSITAMNTSEDKTLLIVDDDKPFQQRLARAMEKRGFVPETADSVQDAAAKITRNAPAFAIVDMRLEDGNGLDVIQQIRQKRPDSRAIVLTGYGNIATAVTAVKLGAIDYLAKPADPDDIVAALARKPEERLSRRKIRCRRTGFAGSTFSASTSCATGMFLRLRAGSTCIDEPCNVSLPSALPGENPGVSPFAGLPFRCHFA